MGFEMQICSILCFSLPILVKCCVHLRMSASKTHASREDYIPQILAVLLEIHRIYIWPLLPFVFCLSFINNSQNNKTTLSTDQGFWPDSGQILRHQYGISVAESQTFLLAKRPSAAMSEEKRLSFAGYATSCRNGQCLSESRWGSRFCDVICAQRYRGNKVSSRRQRWPRQPAPGEECKATKASLTATRAKWSPID